MKEKVVNKDETPKEEEKKEVKPMTMADFIEDFKI